MSFSERLVALRQLHGLTQKQVYEAVGLSAIGYQRYEYGDREPAFSKLIALADYFNVPLDYLTGRGIYANWEQVLQHWDLVIDAAGRAQFPLDGKTEEAIKSYLQAVGNDKIKAGELLSALISQIEFKSSDEKLEVVFHWKFS